MVTIEQQNKVWDIGKNINKGVEHARKFPNERKFRITRDKRKYKDFKEDIRKKAD